ncbi:Hypothetical protein SMAX5B_005653 [Scophthalmus maximus]|uniref:Uncharacterized protein n=1 Tax=Scophthalmus maximus TaxID=52904 RepID=A0A2U9BBE4_SCOMX|nr:Hypothetical protein SMAX5B_005653 [Scophthalmus maximus]
MVTVIKTRMIMKRVMFCREVPEFTAVPPSPDPHVTPSLPLPAVYISGVCCCCFRELQVTPPMEGIVSSAGVDTEDTPSNRGPPRVPPCPPSLSVDCGDGDGFFKINQRERVSATRSCI